MFNTLLKRIIKIVQRVKKETIKEESNFKKLDDFIEKSEEQKLKDRSKFENKSFYNLNGVNIEHLLSNQKNNNLRRNQEDYKLLCKLNDKRLYVVETISRKYLCIGKPIINDDWIEFEDIETRQIYAYKKEDIINFSTILEIPKCFGTF